MSLEGLLGTSLGPALILAFVLGAGHALTPGHGKTIVAAYLAGSRGRISDAVWLGLVVTATHTALVFALGLAALYAAQGLAAQRILPWLQVASGALIFAMGLWLLFTRLRHLRQHHHGHEHTHVASLTALGISSGMAPCPEALAVLMLSVSSGRIATGLALLVAFSLGLAAILIAIGIAMVLAGPALRRYTGETRWARTIPIASAVVITVAGAVLLGAALQSGDRREFRFWNSWPVPAIAPSAETDRPRAHFHARGCRAEHPRPFIRRPSPASAAEPADREACRFRPDCADSSARASPSFGRFEPERYFRPC